LDLQGRKLHDEELYNLYASQYFRIIKSSRMKWEEHVAGMREMRNAYKILIRKHEGKDYL